MTEIMTGRHVRERIMNFLFLPSHLLQLPSLSLLLSTPSSSSHSFSIFFSFPCVFFSFSYFSVFVRQLPFQVPNLLLIHHNSSPSLSLPSHSYSLPYFVQGMKNISWSWSFHRCFSSPHFHQPVTS